MATKANWLVQLTSDLAYAERRTKAMKLRHGLALLLAQIEPGLKGVDALVVATRSMVWVAQVNEYDAQCLLEAGRSYIGDTGVLDATSNGRTVVDNAQAIQQLRSIAGEPSLETMQIRIAALHATD